MFQRSKNTIIASTVGVFWCFIQSPVHAQGFADDFSSDTVKVDFSVYTDALANPNDVVTSDDDGILLNIVHADPTGGDRANYEFYNRNATDSVRSTGQFLGERPATGALRFEAQARLYNSIADGGVAGNDRQGDVEIELVLNLGTAPEEDWTLVCFKDRDANGDSQPLEATREKCQPFQLTELQLDVPYTLEVGVNRATQELYAEINGERITVTSPTPFYTAINPYSWARFRVRDGAESGDFRLSSLIFDSEAANLSSASTIGRYRTDDFDDFSSDDTRSKDVVDGRLRLSATVDSPEGNNDAFLRFAQPNDYIEADLLYSSESAIDTTIGGFAAIRLAGILYNDTTDDSDAGNLGDVWGAVMLIDNADSGLVAEYCVIRSEADDWSVSTDLADGLDNNRCPTFALAISPDTVYNASMSLDQEAKTITFKIDDESVVYNILTDVFKQDHQLRVQARIGSGATGTIVGYIDNLRNDPTAFTDEELMSSVNGNDNSSDSSSSSGSGCSIVSGKSDPTLLALLLAALMLNFRKLFFRSRN